MQEAQAILQWYVDAGVDEAIDKAPRNYFVKGLRIEDRRSEIGDQGSESVTGKSLADAHVTYTLPPISASLPLHHSLAAAIAEARRLADGANSLEALKDAIEKFDGCAIKRTATHTVFSDGNPKARLMLIGEAPGAQEDIQGIPFCGPSGQLLDKMLAAIGYDRTKTYITNTVFWRPPGNRQPNTEELAICKPFVERHIALIDPALLVMVGGTATKAMLETELGITRLRGKRYSLRTPYADKDYPVAIIYHPSYLLRQPAQKRAAWTDLLSIKAQMSQIS